MPFRCAALLLFIALPLGLDGQDKKPPARKAPGPLEAETEHWAINSATGMLPGKDFEEMLEQYYALWKRKAGPANGPSGKLKLKLYFDREEFNSQPGRTGGFLLKDETLHVLADQGYAYNIAVGGARTYLQAAYPGLEKRTDLPPWVVTGLANYLACALWREGQTEIDSLKHPQSNQSLLSLQNLMKGNDWWAFEKGFK